MFLRLNVTLIDSGVYELTQCFENSELMLCL